MKLAVITNLLSYATGQLMSVRFPRPILLPLLRLFAWFYGIRLAEADRPLDQYRSLSELFVRNLKEGLRPIGAGLVSPVDGLLRNFGPIKGGRLEQIKGKEYSVTDLLGSGEWAGRYRDGTFFNLYLAPSDYHHVHSPVSGRIVAGTYIPGALWPVNEFSIRRVNELFVRNERIVTYIECAFGVVAVVMVGATNVGRMTVTYDDWISNQWTRIAGSDGASETRRYAHPKAIAAGERLGTFHLGSTVVILVEPARIAAAPVLAAPVALRFGQAMALPLAR